MFFGTVLIVAFANCAVAAITFSTQFGGDEQSEGNAFGIVAKTKPITVIGLSINIDNGTSSIKIESRPGPGRVDDFDDNGWIFINSFPGVIGQGRNKLTPLPDFDVPVVIHAGTKLVFYLTRSPNNVQGSIWCSVGSSLGSVYASNDDLEVVEGYAAESDKNGLITWKHPRRWIGAIRYSVSNNQLASSTALSQTTIGIPKVCNRGCSFLLFLFAMKRKPSFFHLSCHRASASR
jgi:hypothetical protein